MDRKFTYSHYSFKSFFRAQVTMYRGVYKYIHKKIIKLERDKL